ASLQMPSAELTRCSATPTELATALGSNLEGLFFLFLPKSTWVSVATDQIGTSFNIERRQRTK
ncbi:hypothetical protein L914_06896, partial [Phytophthora nicotianae]